MQAGILVLPVPLRPDRHSLQSFKAIHEFPLAIGSIVLHEFPLVMGSLVLVHSFATKVTGKWKMALKTTCTQQ